MLNLKKNRKHGDECIKENIGGGWTSDQKPPTSVLTGLGGYVHCTIIIKFI